MTRHPTKLFPAHQPQSLDRKTADMVFQKNSKKYVVSQKTDGLYSYLVIGTLSIDNNDVLFCCTVGRNEVVEYFSIKCNKKFFHGTLVVGELIEKKFIAFDCFSMAGENQISNSYIERLKSVSKIQDDISKGFFSINGMEFLIKPVYPISEFVSNFRSISEDDGLIFMPVDDLLTKALPFKWKQKNTIDLLINASFDQNGVNGWTYVIVQPRGISNVTLVTNCNMIETLESLLNTNRQTLNYRVIFECLLLLSVESTVVQYHAIPVKTRSDKKNPNLLATIRGTMESVISNITDTEIVGWMLQDASKPTDKCETLI
jgi:hypothetical protein